MQDGGDALGPPIAEDAAHISAAGVRALDKLGFIADRFLLGGDLSDIATHRFRADLHIADGVEMIGLRIALPDIDAFRHQFAHGGLEVIVADHAAGDARCAGRDAALVDHQNILAAALALGLERGGEMIGGTQAVDAGADDEIFDLFGSHARPSAWRGADESAESVLYQFLNWSNIRPLTETKIITRAPLFMQMIGYIGQIKPVRDVICKPNKRKIGLTKWT